MPLPHDVRITSQMAGTACAIVACGAALVAVCTGITVARTERATTILWTILGTSSITAVTKALVATQWLFRFTAADTILCAVVAQSVPFFCKADHSAGLPPHSV